MMVGEIGYRELFDESFNRTAKGDTEFSFMKLFYEKFVGRSQEIADHFKSTDMQRQFEMARDSLLEMKAFADSFRSDEFLRDLARFHGKSKKSIRPELYDVWLESLVDAVRESDPKFDANIEIAWRVILAPGVAFMKYHWDT